MRIPVAVAASLGLLSSSLMAQDTLRAEALEALGLRNGEVLALDLGYAEGSFTVPVTFQGLSDLIELHPHSVRSATNFEVLAQLDDGTYEPVDVGPSRTYRGTLVGVPGSVVAGSLLDDGLHVRIRLAEGDDYWIQPLVSLLPGAPFESHILYSSSDVLDQGHRCGADLLANNGSKAAMNGGTTYAPGSSVKVAELAVDTDFEFYQVNGSSTPNTTAAVELVISTMNPQYEYEVDITHEITTIIVRTSSNDPYTTTDPGSFLSQFRSHWNNTKGNVVRDVAELFSGKNLDGGVIGIAYVGVVCNKNSAYNVVQNLGSLASRTDLSAHELGHNWNAGHCTCPGWTMNPSLTTANRFIETSSEPSIINWRNGHSCFTDSAGTPIFEDGFESGNLTAGGWTKQNDRPKAKKQARRGGSYGCNMKRTTWIEKQVSTVGFSQVTAVWTWRTKQFEVAKNEEIFAEWSIDGGATWNLIDSHRGPNFQNEEHVLPAAAAGVANFKLRFRTNATGFSSTGKRKRGHVDVVRIIGD